MLFHQLAETLTLMLCHETGYQKINTFDECIVKDLLTWQKNPRKFWRAITNTPKRGHRLVSRFGALGSRFGAAGARIVQVTLVHVGSVQEFKDACQ